MEREGWEGMLFEHRKRVFVVICDPIGFLMRPSQSRWQLWLGFLATRRNGVKRETGFMAQLCGEGRSLAFEGSLLALFRSIGVNRYRRLSLRVAHPVATETSTFNT